MARKKTSPEAEQAKAPAKPIVCFRGKSCELVAVAGNTVGIIIDGQKWSVPALKVKAKNKEAAEALK